MNRRDFVSKAMSAMFTGSWPSNKLLAAQTAALGVEASTEWTLAGTGMRINLGDDGTIRAMEVKNGSEWEAVPFRQGPFAGPSWADVKMQRFEGSASSFVGTIDGVRHSLQYKLEGNRLAIIAGLKNEGAPATPQRLPAWCSVSTVRCCPIRDGTIAISPLCCAAKKHISGDT